VHTKSLKKTKATPFLTRLLCLISFLTLVACGGGGSAELTPVINSLSATAISIAPNESVDITAVFSGGTGTVDNGIGEIFSGVTFTVSPTETTTYTLTVEEPRGTTATQSITITVVPIAEILSFTSSADSITVGDSCDLTAEFISVGGTAEIDNGVGAVSSLTPVTVSPTETTTYALTVTTDSGETLTSSLTVNVAPAATINDTPIITLPTISSFTATDTTITLGDSTDLTATFANGTGDINHSVGEVTSNAATTVSPTTDTIYTLTVTNSDGDNVTQDIAITVVSASLNGAATINAGDSATLTVISANGAAVLIDDGGNTITVSGGSANVSPTSTTTYTLTVTNANSVSATSSVTVTVIEPLAILSSNSSGSETGTTTIEITATYSGGTAVFDSGGGGTTLTSGSPETFEVTISNTTTFTLTVTNSFGVFDVSTHTISVFTPPPLPIGYPSPTVRQIDDNQPITIFFSRAMETGELVLTGSMSGDTYSVAWSTLVHSNDQLVITPLSSWSPGIGKTLTIDAKDADLTSMDTLNLTYDISSGTTYYVEANSDDANNGISPGTARLTISSALSDAVSGDLVLVSAVYDTGTSTYDGFYEISSPITLKQGVTLAGGYNKEFTGRDTVTYETIITDTSSATGGASTPNTIVKASDSAITSATIVDGFTLNGSADGSAAYTSAVWTLSGADPTIQNSIINGGSGTSTSYGIFADSSDPVIRNNLISGGTSPNSYGVNINEATSAFILRNNTISAGTGSTIAYGVSNSTSSSSSMPKVENNIIFSGGSGASRICFYEADTTSSPDLMNNNYLLNCSTTLYRDGDTGCPGDADSDGNPSTCTLAEMQLLAFGTSVGGNIDDADPTFANFTDIDGTDNNIDTMDDNDWHLGNSSPASAAGLNGLDETIPWDFTQDLDGVSRPASGSNWAIGAYEYVAP